MTQPPRSQARGLSLRSTGGEERSEVLGVRHCPQPNLGSRRGPAGEPPPRLARPGDQPKPAPVFIEMDRTARPTHPSEDRFIPHGA